MGREHSSRNGGEGDRLAQVAREDAFWSEERERRKRIAARGSHSVWGHSPKMEEIEEIYARFERMEAEQMEENKQAVKNKNKREENDANSRSSSSSTSSSGRTRKKKKKKNGSSSKEKKDKHKKHLKNKKKTKKRLTTDDNDEEWVEVTNEMRQAEAEREKQKEAELIGPPIPDHLLQKDPLFHDHGRHVNYGKDMLRGEAAAMAAYIAQGKRIPRRGEIGLSSAEIADFEKIGYVMSGTRHKSMEATRLRKENQVMTAEEKRVLSGFTQEERKKKEELVLQQFRSFVDSKKSKG